MTEVHQVSRSNSPSQVHLVMTTYRPDAGRHNLLEATLAALAERTQTPAILWLIDDGGLLHVPLPDVKKILAGSLVSIGGIVQGGDRIGQAGSFNRGYALAEDAVRQSGWTDRTYLVKLEDDLAFAPNWLGELIDLWEDPGLARHNVGMLGGAYGQPGEHVAIGCRNVKITYHVGAWCMFAPLAMWRQYMPIPPRPGIDAQGGAPPTASSADWYLTRRGVRSVAAMGRTCACLHVVDHVGTKEGDSTWKK